MKNPFHRLRAIPMKKRPTETIHVIAEQPAEAGGEEIAAVTPKYTRLPRLAIGVYLFLVLSLILYGILFILLEKWRKRHPSTALLQDLTPKGALWIGLFQSLALIPGTSRSGATVIGGLCVGQTRTAAAEFSFFLAIPTMLGAGALKTLKFFGDGLRLTHEELWMLLVGCLCAFLVSVLTIRMLLELVRRHSFLPFGIYRILLGALVLLTFL